MTKHKTCPPRPKKKHVGDDGFFFFCYESNFKNGFKKTIVVTRDDQLPSSALKADCEGRSLPLHKIATPVNH